MSACVIVLFVLHCHHRRSRYIDVPVMSTFPLYRGFVYLVQLHRKVIMPHTLCDWCPSRVADTGHDASPIIMSGWCNNGPYRNQSQVYTNEIIRILLVITGCNEMHLYNISLFFNQFYVNQLFFLQYFAVIYIETHKLISVFDLKTMAACKRWLYYYTIFIRLYAYMYITHHIYTTIRI